MDSQLWELIERLVRGAEQQDVRSFVSLTRSEMLRRFETTEQLQHGYAQLAAHLHRLKARDDFWSWVDQQFPVLNDSKLALEPEAEDAIVADLTRVNIGRPVAFSLRDLPSRLVRNGWLFLVVWFALFVIALKLWPSEIESCLGLTFTSFNWVGFFGVIALWSVLCRGLLAPQLRRWHRMIRRLHPLLSALATIVVVALASTALYLSTLYYFELWKWGGDTGRDNWVAFYELILPGGAVLEMKGDEAAPLALVGIAAVFWFFCAQLKRRPWFVVRKPSLTERLVSWSLLLMTIFAPLHYLYFLHRARQMPAEIRSFYQELASRPEVEADPVLADQLLSDPRLADNPLLEVYYYDDTKIGATAGDKEQFSKVFLDVGQELWQESSWWESPHYQPLAEAGGDRLQQWPARRYPTSTPAQLESLLRCGFGYKSSSFFSDIEKATLSESDWRASFPLVEQLVARHTPPLHETKYLFYGDLTRSSPVLEGSWLVDVSVLYNALETQNTWQVYLDNRAILEREEMFGRQELQELRSGHDEIMRHLLLARVSQADDARKDSLVWFMVRIQAELAAGRTLPKTLQEFNPPEVIGPLDWFIYKVEEDVVKIGVYGSGPDGYWDEAYEIKLGRGPEEAR